MMDKDGFWAVDLFPVFLQTQGENPKKPMVSWQRFIKAPMFIKLPLVLSGSSEDSTKSEDHDDTFQKRNAKENQYVDAKEPMEASMLSSRVMLSICKTWAGTPLVPLPFST